MEKLLLVIDCQKAFINEYTKEYVEKIKELISIEKYTNVVFTIFKNNKQSPFYNLLNYKECINEADCELMIEYNAPVIEKYTYSAANTDLIDYISNKNIK